MMSHVRSFGVADSVDVGGSGDVFRCFSELSRRPRRLLAVSIHPPCPPSLCLRTLPQEIDTDMELMRSLQSNPRVVLDGAGNMSFKVCTANG